jgi:uncharacterized membrane protein SpoIIM required for sporulation
MIPYSMKNILLWQYVLLIGLGFVMGLVVAYFIAGFEEDVSDPYNEAELKKSIADKLLKGEL